MSVSVRVGVFFRKASLAPDELELKLAVKLEPPLQLGLFLLRTRGSLFRGHEKVCTMLAHAILSSKLRSQKEEEKEKKTVNPNNQRGTERRNEKKRRTKLAITPLSFSSVSTKPIMASNTSGHTEASKPELLLSRSETH